MIVQISNVLNIICQADPDLKHYQSGFPHQIFHSKANDDTPEGGPKSYPALLLNIASNATIEDGWINYNLSILLYTPATVNNVGGVQEDTFVESRGALEHIAQRVITGLRKTGETSGQFTIGHPITIQFDVVKGRAMFHVLEVVIPVLAKVECFEATDVEVVDWADVPKDDLEKVGT